MIHEVLLALSGHPSGLFIDPAPTAQHETVKVCPLPLLSPPESELLARVGQKAYLHRRIREFTDDIVKNHPSTVCRAVAASIKAQHLARFQQKILHVENSILTKDSTIVGAYNIVPLSGIVAEFDDWTRRLDWLWWLVRFINQRKTTGAVLIDRLRDEAKTGYPDVEEAAVELGKTADRAWLQQLSSWLLYGRLPHRHAAADFLIQADEEEVKSQPEFRIDTSLRPCFVLPATASSILFIGKTLNLAQTYKTPSGPASQELKGIQRKMVDEHLKFLTTLSDGINETSLFQAISKIRQSLSTKLLRQLLPLDKILGFLDIFREFFLLGRGEFAIAIVEEGEKKSRSRRANTNDPANMREALRSIMLKEGEAKEVLSHTWTRLSNSFFGGDDDDEALALASRLLRLTLSNPYHKDKSKNTAERTTFYDFLLPVSSYLSIDCPSPLDLFIAPPELETYTSLHAYLLAIRRAHMRLANLWRQRRLRRPAGPLSTNASEERSVWATCRSALFFLSEVGAYFAGDIVQESWTHFLTWVRGGEHDPEQLSNAHIAFLQALQHYLLLSDDAFVASLQRFLRHVDATVGILYRLESTSVELVHDHKDMMLELGRSRKRLDSEMKSLMNRLRRIDAERGSGAPMILRSAASEALHLEMGAFEPNRCGGVDRLLMKLDYGAEMDDGNDLEQALI